MIARFKSKTCLGCLTALLVLAIATPAVAMDDPVTGRWATRDPLGYAAVISKGRDGRLIIRSASHTKTENLHEFLASNPLDYHDPLGTEAAGYSCDPRFPNPDGTGPREEMELPPSDDCNYPCTLLHESIHKAQMSDHCALTREVMLACTDKPDGEPEETCIACAALWWNYWNEQNENQQECDAHLASASCFATMCHIATSSAPCKADLCCNAIYHTMLAASYCLQPPPPADADWDSVEWKLNNCLLLDDPGLPPGS